MSAAETDAVRDNGLVTGEGPRWIPLESDPALMNKWAEQLGLQIKIHSFQDIYGLDPELLALVPKPVKAVLLLFPNTDAVEEARRTDDEKIKQSGQEPVDKNVIFIKQTISNACGTIALLHALANAPDVTVAPESPLDKFISLCKDKNPEDCAELLQTTPLFARLHKVAAEAGQSIITPDLNTNLHFICFVQSKSQSDPNGKRLLELDGRRAAPVDLGPSADFLADVTKVAQEKYLNSTNSLKFSMIALAPTEE